MRDALPEGSRRALTPKQLETLEGMLRAERAHLTHQAEEMQAPVIWGQEEYYIYVQLRDFASGRRVNERMTVASELMKTAVTDLTKEQMKALAKYFSTKPWPLLGFKANPDDAAVAERVMTAGQCPQCHLGAFVGNALAGRRGPVMLNIPRDLLEGRPVG